MPARARLLACPTVDASLVERAREAPPSLRDVGVGRARITTRVSASRVPSNLLCVVVQLVCVPAFSLLRCLYMYIFAFAWSHPPMGPRQRALVCLDAKRCTCAWHSVRHLQV